MMHLSRGIQMHLRQLGQQRLADIYRIVDVTGGALRRTRWFVFWTHNVIALCAREYVEIERVQVQPHEMSLAPQIATRTLSKGNIDYVPTHSLKPNPVRRGRKNNEKFSK
jgi:hypothetical protein